VRGPRAYPACRTSRANVVPSSRTQYSIGPSIKSKEASVTLVRSAAQLSVFKVRPPVFHAGIIKVSVWMRRFI